MATLKLSPISKSVLLAALTATLPRFGFWLVDVRGRRAAIASTGCRLHHRWSKKRLGYPNSGVALFEVSAVQQPHAGSAIRIKVPKVGDRRGLRHAEGKLPEWKSLIRDSRRYP